MNLCIDQGNSRTKVALMTDEGKIINDFISKQFSSAEVERLFDLYEITDSIISSVVNIEAAVVNTLHRRSQHLCCLTITRRCLSLTRTTRRRHLVRTVWQPL